MASNTKKDSIEKKIEYLGLDFEKIPKSIKEFEELEYRIPKFYDENKYRQYRYIKISDIQILLSPTNRLDTLEEKYKKASPLVEYLDNKNEENYIKHTKFLQMLKDVNIDKIEEIEEEQEKLKKSIPFKIRFNSNYLWQIYYSKNSDKYFMLVPTEDTEYEAFFYLLKKKLENKRAAKIFVPISGVEYTNTYLKKSEYQDIESYMWLFTKEWPTIYEVYDKKDNLSIQIVGETEVFGKIKSLYKVKLETKEQANDFYRLIKVMFILQTELPNYYNFTTNISKDGSIEFYLRNAQIKYENMPTWIKDEYKLCEKNKQLKDELIKLDKEKLEKLKEDSVLLDLEYIEKEKQITTFLECKKTFFGKVKYYFKYGKAKRSKTKQVESKENKVKNKETIEEQQIEGKNELKKENINKENYTLEELIQSYKEYELKENELKNIIMDINALKLKNKNLEKKIENAKTYIQEIDSHKKSIFEFWKYSNKDEMTQLPEGEEEEINIVKKIVRTFDYEDDIDDFGKKYDKILRKVLLKEETDALYITNTNVLELLDGIKNNTLSPKDIENNLKQMKKEASEEKTLSENEEFDIFGGIVQDNTKVNKIKDKKHRELKKDKFNILEISKNANQIGYKLILEQIINNIKSAIEKVEITEEIPVYKAVIGSKIDKNNINIFNVNPENEIKEALSDSSKDTINLYKINLIEKTNAIPYTNIVFYDNQNRTLPTGMDISTKILIDMEKLNLEEETNFKFRLIDFENKSDEFSKINVKDINVIEYNVANI